jgi:hypothetical protein
MPAKPGIQGTYENDTSQPQRVYKALMGLLLKKVIEKLVEKG